MKRSILLTILLVLLLNACGPSQEQIQATVQASIEQTQQALPTETPTIVLSEINLDPVLFQAGDLPNHYTSGLISYRWASNLPKPYEPDNIVIQKVGWNISEGFDDDYLLIALFESESELKETYKSILDAVFFSMYQFTDVGEESAFRLIDPFSGRGFFTFIRCKALVAIDITGADIDIELMTSFAARVEKRLTPIACQ